MNLGRFKEMCENDRLFLFHELKLVAGLRIRLTWRLPVVSTGIWGFPDWELVYALDNLVRYNIPKPQCLEWLNYGDTSIRGLMRAGKKADLDRFMAELKENGGIP